MRSTFLLFCAVALSGCTTDAINVSEGVLAEKVNYLWLLSTREGEKAVFSPTDEKVVLSVRFDYNYRGSYEWYKVEWIAPSGEAYQVVSTRTEFGSHRDLKAELPIRGKMAAALPGLWQVRLSHLGRDGAPDRLLLSRLFRIEPMSEEMRAAIRIDPPAPDERPLAGTLPADSVVEPSPVAPTLADTAVVSAGAPAPAGEPEPPGESVAVPAVDAAPAGIPAVLAQSTPSASAEPPAPEPAPAGNVDLDAAPLSRSGVLIAELLSVPSSVKAPSDAPPAQTPPRGDSAVSRQRWPGCPPLYYPPGPDCVEQAPQE